jgi:ABC-type polysaccharide/polyol phosphate transport system ATPase subunit
MYHDFKKPSFLLIVWFSEIGKSLHEKVPLFSLTAYHFLLFSVEENPEIFIG